MSTANTQLGTGSKKSQIKQIKYLGGDSHVILKHDGTIVLKQKIGSATFGKRDPAYKNLLKHFKSDEAGIEKAVDAAASDVESVVDTISSEVSGFVHSVIDQSVHGKTRVVRVHRTQGKIHARKI